jgi:Flp pilus assembly protein TadD
MHLRALFTAALAVFLSIVLGSFVYGVRLLYRVAPAAPISAARSVSPEEIRSSLAAAEAALGRGETEQAIVAFRRVLAATPSIEGQLGLARGELRAGRQEVAVQEFERALSLEPHNPQALLELARIDAQHASSWPRAEDLYREYVAAQPEDAEAELGLGRLLLWEGKTASGVEVLSKGPLQKLMTPQDRKDYAFALVRAGRTGEAEPLLRALAHRGEDDEVSLQLAGLHASRAEWAVALPLYKSVLEHRPSDPKVKLDYGQALLASGDAAGALAPLENAAEALPQSGEAALAYARALRKAGDLKKAPAQFERAAAKYPQDASVNRECGDLWMERRDHKRATLYYRRAMDLGLRDDRILVALAGALADDQPRDAIPLLEEVYGRAPNDRVAYDLAKLYRRTGRPERALELLGTIGQSPRPPSR